MPPPPAADQDDLDDLDDVLDQFSAKPEQSPVQPTFSGRPRTNTRVDGPPIPAPGNGLVGVTEGDEDPDANALAADFAAELAKGMESLMREISGAGEGSAAGEGSGPGVADEAALKAAWEAMLIEGMDGMTAGANAATATSKDAGEGADDFQAKIRQAMGKLREGEETLQESSGAGANAPAPDSLEALLAQLNELGGADGDSGLPTDESELAGFLENMMGELMSKEVLYEPLTELADKFPPYLASPPAPLSADDRTRYEAQLTRVRSILAIFDAPTFDEADPKTRGTVVALMAEMQSFGSPPTELMGPLPPGLGALGEDGCVVA
ncbi:Pex19 protein family-domain-containing protein [Mycena alexandri]|uniref:Pex19 protein family-domain-containing protein n=1 Tax=Mycena alexandri TaxID=1745969 RepID=A0AAD6T5E0_9AGAR|nr:Pex19 protein family-domain-containing protein [Mycena alexandri]